MRAAIALFKCMQDDGIVCGPAYGTAMQAHVLAGEREHALALYEHAVREGVEMGTIEANIAIGAAARCGNLDVALRILGEVSADVGSYDAIFTPLASAGRHAEVLMLFERMEKSG